jgi:glycine dehydrogenase subunit 1
MTALGKKGVQEIATQNILKTNYAKKAFEAQGFEVVYQGPHFNEIVVKADTDITVLTKELLKKGIIGGFDLGKVDDKLAGHVLIAVTEQRTKEEIDALVQEMGSFRA